jgi:hypothetical protein
MIGLLNENGEPDEPSETKYRHDSMMMEKMREELARVQKEHSRILDQFGGVLSLDED